MEPPVEWETRIRSTVYSGRFVIINKKPLITVYLGSSSDYILVDSIYCSCEAFTRNIAKRLTGCKHVFALKEALKQGKVREIRLGANDVAVVAWEIFTGGITKTLRQKIYRWLEEDMG